MHSIKCACMLYFVLCSVAQPCLTLCDPTDCGPPGSSVHEFSRQENWDGLPFHTLGYLPNPRIEAKSLASPALAGNSLKLHHLGTSITTFKCTVQEYHIHLYCYATVNNI